MKTWMKVSGWVTVTVLLSGCVVSIGGSGTRREEVPKPPPVMIVPADSPDSIAMAEIDAAAKLSFEANRRDALKNIASRPALNPPVQVHLVNTALRCLDFESGRVEVLRTLIANPGFASMAKEAILKQIERLEFEGSRTTILRALQDRAASS